MFRTIGDKMQMFTCTTIIEQPDGCQQNTTTAPRLVHEQSFMRIVHQAANHPSPIRLRLIRTEPFYDKFDKEWYNQEYGIEFANNAWLQIHREDTNE